MIRRQHSKHRSFFAVLVITGVLPLIFGSSIATAAFPGANGKIAFDGRMDGNEEIYLMNDDGTERVNISNNPASDTDPAWSPNGRRIAFVSFRDGNSDIFVMNWDGSGVTNLTDGRMSALSPTWSPDGLKIVFVCYSRCPRGGSGLVTMNPDGSVQHQITRSDDHNPSWSPARDDWRIAFDRDGEIYGTNSTGTSLDRLTDDPASDTDPDWSPDGRLIAFTSDRVDARQDTNIMNSTGSAVTRITTGRADDYSPAWSPNQRKIVFTKYRRDTGLHYIYVMPADGAGGPAGQIKLVEDADVVDNADWQPINLNLPRNREYTRVRGTLR